jgi:hypothetical protein
MSGYSNGVSEAVAAPDTQATSAPNQSNRHERRVHRKQTLPPPIETPAEPKLHSLEWFDAVLSNNEAVAAQKLAEYHQVLGAINILKAQRDAVIAEAAKG